MDEIAIVLACDDHYAQLSQPLRPDFYATLPSDSRPFIFISLMMESPV